MKLFKIWGIETFAEKTKSSLEDIAARTGRNLDIVFFTIAATIVSPTLAVLGALLSSLYASGESKQDKNSYDAEINDYSVRDLIYRTIIRHNYNMKKRLIAYGFREPEANRFLHDVVYEGYIDSIIANHV